MSDTKKPLKEETPLVVHALERGLNILRCFDVNHQEWSQIDLAKKCGLHKATLHRFVKTLEMQDFLLCNNETGKYSLGPAIFQMAYSWLSQNDLIRIAYPHVDKLAAESGETCGMTILTPEGALVVIHIPTTQPFKPVPALGQIFTDLADANTRLLVAYESENVRNNWINRSHIQHTPNTVTDPKILSETLDKVAADGMAIDLQEHQLGVCGLVVPVFDFSNHVRATLALSAPVERFNVLEVDNYITLMKKIAADISYDLGYRGHKR